MRLLKSWVTAAMVAAGTIASMPAHAAEYVMSASADFSGPFADVMPSAMSGIWNSSYWVMGTRSNRRPRR